MKTFKNLSALGALSFLALLAGCGGESVATEFNFEPKGEGSIPIGRAVLPRRSECAIRITMSDGRVYSTVTRGETVFGPCLPKGKTKVVVTPFDTGYSSDEFEYVVGNERHMNFVSRPIAMASCPAVKGVEANITDGQRFRRGQSLTVKARIVGSRFAEVAPTIIVSGGIGKLNIVNRVLFTQVGVGKIIVEVCGIKREYTVIVTG